jgi:hypothetical protein
LHKEAQIEVWKGRQNEDSRTEGNVERHRYWDFKKLLESAEQNQHPFEVGKQKDDRQQLINEQWLVV